MHSLALGHNGNLVNTAELAERVGKAGTATTDSDLVTTLMATEMVATGGLERGGAASAAHARRARSAS